ncbi:amidase [Hymenobacter sp. BT491]|uniref:amidase n=1 Tax=Hymenobacter sp. BT491 TaxID=2766779 RepID=UPI001653DC48|nr:amidase [Hymenobacter sp. BT491]MBC6991578.1 amidase [Hymenobacter sp. BT491]
MNRRIFLRNGSLAGLALSTLSLSACGSGAPEQKDAAAADTPSRKPEKFELDELTINELQDKMRSGAYTARALTEHYLKRIEAIDKGGPQLHSVIELNPDALTIADSLDQERKNGKVRGPLHGIPVLIKDNIDSGDKMMTTAGALALVGHKATKDAFIVKKLRDAGAVLLGKTNLSEWANFRSTHSTSGWSGRGGQTKNAYVLDRTPSGSSAGSGVAVSANLCAVAIGTETDGSVVSPSSSSGIVGLKPTVGLLSRSGIIPISATQDTAGPMTRTVRDAAILLGALTGVDPEDAITKESTGKAQTDYTKLLTNNALQGKRIGVEKSHVQGNHQAIPVFKKALELLKSQGATVVEVDIVKPISAIGEAEFTVLLYEFKDGVNKYLATANAPVKTLADVIAFNQKNEPKAMPYFKQEILEMAEKKGDLKSKEYQQALQKEVSTARRVLDNAMKDNKLDAIIGITSGPAACIDLINGDYSTGLDFSTPAAIAGYPHLTVPMGQVYGLPVGISFVGRAYQEAEILALGYAYEQASKHRTAPTFRATFI